MEIYCSLHLESVFILLFHYFSAGTVAEDAVVLGNIPRMAADLNLIVPDMPRGGRAAQP